MSRPFATESVFRALGHPLRRRILDLLRKDEYSVGDLHQALTGMGRTSLSDHLRILRESGLVSQRRRGTFRMYALNNTPLKTAIGWLRPFEHFKPRRPARRSM